MNTKLTHYDNNDKGVSTTVGESCALNFFLLMARNDSRRAPFQSNSDVMCALRYVHAILAFLKLKRARHLNLLP